MGNDYEEHTGNMLRERAMRLNPAYGQGHLKASTPTQIFTWSKKLPLHGAGQNVQKSAVNSSDTSGCGEQSMNADRELGSINKKEGDLSLLPFCVCPQSPFCLPGLLLLFEISTVPYCVLTICRLCGWTSQTHGAGVNPKHWSMRGDKEGCRDLSEGRQIKSLPLCTSQEWQQSLWHMALPALSGSSSSASSCKVLDFKTGTKYSNSLFHSLREER